MMTAHLTRTLLIGALLAHLVLPARAQDEDPARVCDAAAARAERDWSVPAGVLAAIGTVESGRAAVPRAGATPWPWTINADGRGFFFATKGEAIRAAAALLAANARFVDVGCFQVDLYFHGRSFASLDHAFDPETNAQIAARILVAGRFGDQDWAGAVARYHSASPILGAEYLAHVRAVFAHARSRVTALLLDAAAVPGVVVLLSPAAQQVRVIYGADPAPATLPPAKPADPFTRRPGAPPEPQIIHLRPAPKPAPELLAERP